ncbi:MAG: hypothetical protein KatS3mg031_0098 [Chitinophagales bacterium]|nr:MAG: hypothetical protein KatS3mg031_0098 [Chitinophagales bacterium]
MPFYPNMQRLAEYGILVGLLMGCSGIWLPGSVYAQIKNPGFENWTNLRPDDWVTNSCPECDPPWETYIARQDSDAYAGNHNVDLLANGRHKPFVYQYVELAQNPVHLQFYTKVLFPPCVNEAGFHERDTIKARIELFSNGLLADSVVWMYADSSWGTYQPVDIPLPASAIRWDSCRIYFEGGMVYGGCGVIPAPTRFKIDEVALIYPSCEAAFSYLKNADTVQFSGFSNLTSATRWQWNFGDGNADTASAPVHIYEQEGWYTVCVYVEGLDSARQTCSATFCDSVFITRACIDSTLICRPIGLCCDAPLYMPVCGCDGITYDNVCQARLWYGVTRVTEGSCLNTSAPQPDSLKVQILARLLHERYLQLISTNPGRLDIGVYSLLGQKVAHYNFTVPAGVSMLSLEAESIRSGLYYLTLLFNGKHAGTKTILIP